MSRQAITVEQALQLTGVGTFQYRLFAIFGLVWMADAMQVLSIGFSAPSIAQTFGITMAQALHTGTLFFVGMLLGAFVFGRLADRIGRRPVLMMAVLIDACAGVASAFASDFTWLLVLRFITGVGVGGTLPVDYTMMAEFLPSRRRGRWLVMLESFWAIGTILLALLALMAVNWGNDAWRVIFFVTGLPALIGVVLRLYVPESPMYLNRNDRSAQAQAVLQRVADTNGNHVQIPALEPEAHQTHSLFALFSAQLRRRSVALFAAWALISIAYYAIFVYLPIQLSSQGFGFMRGQEFLVLLALVQLPGFALSAYGVERWGRKPTLVGFLMLSALGCMIYSLGTTTTVVVGATLLMSFALLGTWGALYAFTPEVYPTDLRASGMGSAGAVARFGGLFAPSIIAPLMTTHFTFALAAIASMLLLAAFAVRMVDVESKDLPLG
ncbi:MAG: MFS transporter [Comamonas sp.]